MLISSAAFSLNIWYLICYKFNFTCFEVTIINYILKFLLEETLLHFGLTV